MRFFRPRWARRESFCPARYRTNLYRECCDTFLPALFLIASVDLQFSKFFLKKSATDYDKNPKNLIHQCTHVVHKSLCFKLSDADLDDRTFHARDRRLHCPAARKWNQTARGCAHVS